MNRKPIAIITGSTGTLGSALSKRLVADGYLVYGIGRDRRKGKEMQRELSAKAFRFHQVDVRNEIDVRNFFKKRRDDLKNIDLLVTCAGVLTMAPFEKGGMNHWRNIIDTNLYGTLYCIYHVLPLMKARSKGSIVSIGSRWGESGAPKAAVYSASKSALKGFIKSLQIECIGTGVRPILLSPGSIMGHMSDQVNARDGGKMLNPAELAQIVSFVAANSENVIFDEVAVKAFAYDLTHPY